MSVFCFYRHLSLKACGHVFRFQFSLEDKRGLSLGELIRPFCIMFSYCYLWCFLTAYVWKTCTQKGPSRNWQRPCSVSSPLNSSKRPRRKWRGSLPHLATLPTLTRVKLDSSSGRAKGGKVVCPTASTPGRPMGIRPQDAALGLRVGGPTQ